MGDDSLLQKRRRDAQHADLLHHIVARGPYDPSEIRQHCQEMYARKMEYLNPPVQQPGTSTFSGMLKIFGRSDQPESTNSQTQIQRVQPGAHNPHQALWDKARDFAIVHRSVDKFLEAGITFVTLYDAGVTITELIKSGQYTLRELHELDMTWEHLLLLELSWEHLKDPLPFPASDLQAYFGVTYMHVIMLAAGEGRDVKLGLTRFCSIGFNRNDLLHLRFDDMSRLMDLGLTKANFIALTPYLYFEDMVQFKLRKEHLEKLDLMSIEQWNIMRWGDPDNVCNKLGIPKSMFAPAVAPPKSDKGNGHVSDDDDEDDADDPSGNHHKDVRRVLPSVHKRTKQEEVAYAIRALTRPTPSSSASDPRGITSIHRPPRSGSSWR